MLRRAFEDSGLPVSRAGKSRLQLAFGTPLPVNAESNQEFMEFYMSEYILPDRMIRSLNEILPAELAFEAVEQVAMNTPSLFSEINGADYSVDLTSPAACQAIHDYAGLFHIEESEAILHAIDSFERAFEVMVIKHKTDKSLNAKEFVRAMGLSGDRNLLMVEVKIIDGKSVGIRHILQTLLHTQLDLPVKRDGLYIWKNESKQSPLYPEDEALQTRKHLMDYA